MFSRPFLMLFIAIFLAAQSQVWAAPNSGALKKAESLVQSGQWDKAEVNFLKAAASPEFEERILAYQGLVNLYKKLRLFKKAARAQAKLDEEKKFESKLLPGSDSYYQTYQLKRGDSYGKLASRYGVSQKWLMRANGGKPLIEGKKIRVPKLRYEIVVDKDERTLLWKRGSEIIKAYPVAIGRKGMDTPEGDFKVTSKVAHPVWYHEKKQIPPDSPENLLGTRWLGLNQKGYGIHGTRNPETIREAASHGCVRMFNRDVEELFEWIPVGTRVSIRS
jgi:lipoprotein-anchoring transpeptidase ErfK/SrfK